ncbi:MAG TPA: carbohydrate ABC transporter permease [Candidatus Pacearchaeota archaeon]|nr:carbohydrate ABC transporter permease [Candidatus Pacearchaeota archaeon]
MPKQKKYIFSSITDILIWIFLIVFAIMVLVPLVFMFTASFMPAKDIMTIPFPWIPKTFYIENYKQAIRGNDGSYIFLRNILNSFIVAALTTIGTIFLCSITGYGLAKFEYKGRNFILIMILSTMMIPFEAIMVPLYLTVTNLGWQDTYAALIIPFLMSAFGVFLMRQFLITFPDELLDAARIDGASEIGIFFKVVLPNSIPPIATLAVLTFRSQWDSLLWPLLVIQTPKKKTIPLYIVHFAEEKFTNEGALMAAAAIASIPMIILFLTLTKYFIGGSNVYTGGKE